MNTPNLTVEFCPKTCWKRRGGREVLHQLCPPEDVERIENGAEVQVAELQDATVCLAAGCLHNCGERPAVRVSQDHSGIRARGDSPETLCTLVQKVQSDTEQ